MNTFFKLKNKQENIAEKQANMNTEKTTRNIVNCKKQDYVKRSLSVILSLQSPVFFIALASGSPSSLCLLFGTMFIILSKASYHPQVLHLQANNFHQSIIYHKVLIRKKLEQQVRQEKNKSGHREAGY